MKKKASAPIKVSADLHMGTMNLLLDSLIKPRRKSAMVFGTKDAVVMGEDASLATKRSDGKTKHVC